ncbi:MAG: hypothetical protein IJU71_07670, partial [Selenomonadaceae bacterium]|nr:hypothetical protein [Selenomonadaceae bacterium]
VLSTCQEELGNAQRLVEETQAEEQNSRSMLEAARTAEEAAHAAMLAAEGVLIAAKARMAAAAAEEMAALASGNPFAITAATAEAAAAAAAEEEARRAYEIAKQAYEIAKAHRELMERRYEMAQQAVNLSQVMHTKLQARCGACQAQLAPLIEQGMSRLQKAHDELQKYHGQYDDWKNYQPRAGRLADVNEFHARLNPSKEIMSAILNERYQTDEEFRRRIDDYRARLKDDPAEVERQIKIHVTGDLAERIVVGALAPYGERIDTQVKHDVEGGYTKTDIVLHDLKVPMSIGRGEGMGAREGRSVAIEVKSGKENYLSQQREHLKFQAQGHRNYDASWVICTRDIRNVGDVSEYRQEIRDAGSPPVGMLPYKAELDEACLKFVREGVADG